MTGSELQEYFKKKKFLEEKEQCYTDSTWWDSLINDTDETRIRSYDNDD